MKFLRQPSYLVIACILLQSCSVGPEYVPPTATVPAQWSGTSHNNLITKPKTTWWQSFNDPLLNKLEEQQVASNLSLQTAKARIQTARAEYSVAYAQMFPRANADFLPPDGTGEGLTQVFAISAFLEPDLFGKQKQNRQRAQAIVDAEEAEYAYTLLNLQAEIASSYLELREAQKKDEILHHTLTAGKQVLGLLTSRYHSGLSNYLNTSQQDALILTQLAEIEQNKAIIMMIIHKLELLTGNPPGLLTPQLAKPRSIPQITQKTTLEIPSEILRRRPDIIAAERRVAAAHANIRVATANLFPQVTALGWLYAWQTQALSTNLLALQNTTSSVLATFNIPLLNLTINRMVDVREREKAVAVLQYDLAILRALHEVETQYEFCQHYEKSAAYLKHAVEKKRLAFKLAKNSYQNGASDFNTVLMAQEDLNHLELSYLHNVVIFQMAKIKLYTALGGGYEVMNVSK